MNRLRPSSLSARLLLTTVALVAVIGLLVTVTSTAIMSSYLSGQLDDEVRGAAQRSGRMPAMGGPDAVALPRPRGGLGSSGPFGPGDELGSLTALVTSSLGRGEVLVPGADGPERRTLDAETLARLQGLIGDPGLHTVDLQDRGSYRVLVTGLRGAGTTQAGSVAVVRGLPRADLERAVTRLWGGQLALTGVGVLVAALAGLLLTRQALRPLRQVAATAHEVSELPLDSGSVGRTARVPEALTDPGSEVGQVGAALNRLLGHVESALDARQDSEQRVRRFVADASHELRTPLSTIMGYAELARRSPEYDAHEALAKVESEGTRMRALVEDLLLLARLDSGRPLARDEVELTRLVLESVADARVLGPGHQWVLDLPQEPIVTTGDAQRLHQVLSNLLTNARRHTPDGTTVTVELREEQAGVVIEVTDDGPGVPLELQPEIFSRFSRADASRTRDSGGAGLGLALVEAITASHGGTVGLRSVPGRTVFTVRLPT